MNNQEKAILLTDQQLTAHVKNNTSNKDYNFDLYRGLLDYDYKTGVTIDLEKLKSNSFLMDKIYKNFQLAEDRVNKKLAFELPTVGDFIKIDGKYFLITHGFYDSNNNLESFQYSEVGSLYMSKDGFCSYSGGFCFDYGGRIKTKALRLKKEKKQGEFWFFSQDYSGASMGVYFLGDFKVWKVDKKQLTEI
jgi:hypothetical protein